MVAYQTHKGSRFLITSCGELRILVEYFLHGPLFPSYFVAVIAFIESVEVMPRRTNTLPLAS